VPGEPTGAGVQVPGVTLHAWHVCEHALPQQKPLTQNVLAHCAMRVHGWPLVWPATQAAPLHQFPVEQSLSLAQLVGQIGELPLHRYAPQLAVPLTFEQVPSLPAALHDWQAPLHT
jgi:hypothetical protein